jgi:lysophospholipase L1-like esterase
MAAIVLSACGDDEPKITEPATAVIVGDSLLYQSSADVQRELDQRGWKHAIYGIPGAGIVGGYSVVRWADRLRELVRASKPDIVVIELGTNGCAGCTSLDDAIDAIMKPLRSVERVYWVNVREDAPVPSDPKALNDALERAKDRFDNLRIIDMNDDFDDHPGWIIEDGIHFSDAGEREFAKMLAEKFPDQT